MNNDLIERYIYAVTKRMPNKLRKDVSDELHTLISDMLEERCGELAPTEKDIRVILTELGTPDDLYEKYDGDSQKCLIGAPYYSTYKFVLKIVLLYTVFGMSIAGLISQLFEPAQVWYEVALQWFGMLWSGLIFAFCFVTLLFALFYHKGVNIDTSANLDNLPPIPKSNERIPKWEPVIGILISVVFMIVFLLSPQIFCVILSESKEFIPIFDIGTIKSTWYLIVAFGLIGIIKETIKLIDCKYTSRVMIATIVADILSGVLSFWWLLNDKIMNPKFVDSITALFEKSDEFIGMFFANFQCFFLGIALFALILDAITTVVKTIRQPSL